MLLGGEGATFDVTTTACDVTTTATRTSHKVDVETETSLVELVSGRLAPKSFCPRSRLAPNFEVDYNFFY